MANRRLRHRAARYGEHRYPAQLVIQDVLTLHGAQFREADLIVASPPCQFFSYCAMPWSSAKALAAEVRADPLRLERELALFRACFRIQREACDAAGRHIPMIVENVRGAQPWVGRARWNFGSYYLWGDVPVLMPITKAAAKAGVKQHGSGRAWFDKLLDERRKNPDALKVGGDWFGVGNDQSPMRQHHSGSTKRKMASAMIAKIPLPLSRHIAKVFHPRREADGGEKRRLSA